MGHQLLTFFHVSQFSKVLRFAIVCEITVDNKDRSIDDIDVDVDMASW